MAKRIPDRWREYAPCNWTPIKDERIISFKTPLSAKYDHEHPDDDGILESERFTPTDLVNGLAKKGFDLGLVIDFTFTKRYYNPQEFRQNGILYSKLMCPGHEIPHEEDVKRFEHEVQSYLDNNSDGSLVGVHCTHGINRAGYMLCRFLIDCRMYKPDDAIRVCNEARGYPIERENYLDDLMSRKPGHGIKLPSRLEGKQKSIERFKVPHWQKRENNLHPTKHYKHDHYESQPGDLRPEYHGHRPYKRSSTGTFHHRPPSSHHYQKSPPYQTYGNKSSVSDFHSRNGYYSNSHSDNNPRSNYYDNRFQDTFFHRDGYRGISYRDDYYDKRYSHQRDDVYFHRRFKDIDHPRHDMSRNDYKYEQDHDKYQSYQDYGTKGNYSSRSWHR